MKEIVRENNLKIQDEEGLRRFLDEIPIAVMIIDIERKICFSNRQANYMNSGISLVGKTCIDTFCRNSECDCPIGLDGRLDSSRRKFYLNSKNYIPVLKTAQPLIINGRRCFLEFLVDVSEQQATEDELRQKTHDLLQIIEQKEIAQLKVRVEARNFEQLFEQVNDSLFLHDPEGNILKVNERACQQLGYSKDKLTSMNIRDIYPSSDIHKLKELISTVFDKGRIIFELNYKLNSGVEIPVEVISSVFEYNNGPVIFSSVRDISSRKVHEKQLLQSKLHLEENEAELEAIFNHAPSTMFVFNNNAEILRLNRAGLEIYQLQANIMQGIRPGDLMNCINTSNRNVKCGSTDSCISCDLANALEKTINNGEVFDKVELSTLVTEGECISTKTMLLSTAVLKKNGESKFLATLDDITERKRIEQALIIEKENAEKSERLKSAFINNMSHEIRTPLNGIIGFSSLLDDENLSMEDKKSYIEYIKLSGNRLMAAINDILELAKMESGLDEVRKDTFVLKPMIDEFLNDFLKYRTDAKREFSFFMEKEIKDCLVETDKNKLTQIMHYLLDNAFKFTWEGRISLSVRKRKNNLEFTVSDNGIGIAPEDQQLIFEPFRQADIVHTRAYEGNGLGLTITRKMVKCLGGELWLESMPGKGSDFHFNLSNVVRNKYEKMEHTINTLSLNGKEILIAEDDITNYTYLKVVLTQLGCHLIRAENGREAVNLLRQNSQLDLVIMDMKMPEMDGIEATRKIRELNNEIPIIAHSAYFLGNEKQQMLEAGCNDYLLKPVTPELLTETVRKFIFHPA